METSDALQIARQLHGARRFAEAETAYRRILAINPENGDALHGLGWLAHEVGHDKFALQALDQAVASRGTDYLLHWRIAIVSEKLEEKDRANAAYARACELRPKERDLLDQWGVFLARHGQLDRAIEVFKRAVRIDPNFAMGYRHLGMAFDQISKLPEAEEAFRTSLRLEPRSADSLQRLGQTLAKLNRIDEASDQFQRALAIDPNHFGANFNLAVAYRIAKRYEETIAPLERALTADPGSKAALIELARNFADVGAHDKALPLLDRAVALNPDDSDVHGQRALSLLALGDLSAGFKEYEWRWKSSSFPHNRRYSHVPQWTGFDITGKTILLYTEQGYGDAIQFIRYAPLVAGRGARVLLQGGKELLPLLETVGGVSECIDHDDMPSHFDVQCALLSLPFAFGTTLETIPAKVPYLHPDPRKVERWRTRLRAPSGMRKIGLVWAGRSTHRRDGERSIPLELLAPLAHVSNAVFYSLQKGKAANERVDGFDLVPIGQDLNDFTDSAAAIAELDLVISVDTAVVHLAGALAKPVWTLIGAFTDFRWMVERDDTPWYPRMRLFRQSRRGDWTSTIQRVVAELQR